MAARDGRGEDVRVAVLGTGIMGSAMARNLVSARLRTTIWDRSPTATAPLSEAGALVAASPPEAARDAHVVITMLPTADVVNSVIVAGGVAQALAEGAVWAQNGHDRPCGHDRDRQPARSAAARCDVRGCAGIGQQGPRGGRPAAHPGVRPARSGRGRAPGIRGDRPQDRGRVAASWACDLGGWHRPSYAWAWSPVPSSVSASAVWARTSSIQRSISRPGCRAAARGGCL
jgi:NAD binding domain of 6-phosphogluconate dehydrogenase